MPVGELEQPVGVHVIVRQNVHLAVLVPGDENPLVDRHVARRIVERDLHAFRNGLHVDVILFEIKKRDLA